LAFLSGILIVLQFPELPPLWLQLTLVSASIGCLACRNKALRITGFMLLGCCWAMLRAGMILSHELDPALEGRTLAAEGQVVSLPEYREGRTRFEFRIDRLIAADGQNHTSPGKVRLSWYGAPADILPGQIWRLTVRLKRPYGFSNPGGFDYEAWLFRQQIRATGYVPDKGKQQYTGKIHGQYINRLRYYLRAGILNLVENRSFAGLITGLSLGDRSLIDSGARDILIRTGTNHLLAISGLHIGLVAGLFYVLARRLWSLSGILPLYIAAPRIALWAAITGASGYAVLAGLSIPTQRALIMVTVVMLGLFSHRRYAISHILCVALGLVLLLDPFAALDAGFWLSFSAIAIIAYGMSCRVDTDSLWWRWGRTQYLIGIGLMPLLVMLFGQYPLTGFPANLISIPWVSFIVIPLVLSGTVLMNLIEPVGRFCLQLAESALGLLWPFLEWLAGMDQAVWQQASFPVWVLVMAVIGSMILLQPAGLPARWVGAVWLLPLVFPLQPIPDEKEVWFTLLDVGQGLSAVVQTRNHALVYDTGARFSEDFNAGSAVVVPYLRQAQIRHIDSLIISHGDNDHIGGAADVLAAFPQTQVLTSVPDKIHHHAVTGCHAGQSWQWDGVDFSVLHPAENDLFKGNNRSCVLKINNGNRTILLTGDIEKQVEHRLVEKYGRALAAHILVAPHHGSKSSSTPGFINTVAPDMVLFPAGYRNRYRFPNQDIIERYEYRGVRMHDTARHGAITIKITQAGMTISSHRHSARRFWHTVDNQF
jgi:competence protein ComEC